MRARLQCCALLLFGALGSACATTPAAPPPVATSTAAADAAALAIAPARNGTLLRALVERFWQETLELNPTLATYTGDNRYNDRFENNLSAEYLRAARELEQRYLDEAVRVDRAALSSPDQLTLDIFLRDRRVALEAFAYPEELLPFNQFYSRVNEFAQMGAGGGVQPFATAHDYHQWLSRVGDFVAWTEQAIVNLRLGLERGVVLPRIVVERTLPQVDALIVADPERSDFYGPIRQMPADVRGATRQSLTDAYRRAILTQINPALTRLAAFLRRVYLPRGRASVGLSALPGGAQWYAYRARYFTTTGLTPDEIHALGLAEVARIRAGMLAVKAEVGFPGDLRAFLDAVRVDPRFYFQRSEDLLAGYRSLQRSVEARLPDLFALAPRSRLEVRPIEPFRERSAAIAEYQQGTPDGVRPGIFYVNTYDLPSRPKYLMETTFLHEALPGHHFQLSLQTEAQDLPSFRRYAGYTAYVEGWGLYAETLGPELGLQADPYSRLGALSDEALRAVRLVIDTGLHTRGWTREQGIEYMLENTAVGRADAEAEVERYIAIPGQALAYKLGQLKFAELRARAQARLGVRFDLRVLHTRFLVDGALPLDVLDAEVERWIEAQEAAH
jgi:uncharacterized protein (DUF885 family)